MFIVAIHSDLGWQLKTMHAKEKPIRWRLSNAGSVPWQYYFWERWQIHWSWTFQQHYLVRGLLLHSEKDPVVFLTFFLNPQISPSSSWQIRLSLMSSAFFSVVVVSVCFPSSLSALFFLISNLNPQQGRALHCLCGKIRTPYYRPTKRSSGGIFIRMNPPNALNPTVKLQWHRKGASRDADS